VNDAELDPSAAPARIGSRREARETALGILYEADVRAERPGVALGRQVVPPPAYTTALLTGIDADLDAIDAAIRAAAKDWALERMPVIDRSVIRLAVFELLHRTDVPTSAVLTEAVELAAAYSTAESSRFVNGVLGRLAADLRPPPPAP
jgi:N utilization substance protein B